ncbi:MAG: class I SAM-dependent methyltransferase [Acidimicrobiales bacterium]|nr:class I SAM-dependent methyltransferase [Acidimicrobiales bacterium]
MDGYEASTYGDRFADVYDDWYGDVSDAEGCAAKVAALVADAGGGPVLELGIGSGRLALPLVERGLEVHGIDASEAMVAALRAKPGAEHIRVAVGDMAVLELPEPPPFAVVLVAFNTFFNLPTAAEQGRCLERVANLLAPEGHLLIEAFVPDAAGGIGIDGAVTPRRIATDEVVLSVSQRDRAAQTISGQHVHVTEAGIRLRPWHLRYATPDQLDALAAAAGLELAWRAAGWAGEPFTDDSAAHVSAYRRGRFRA